MLAGAAMQCALLPFYRPRTHPLSPHPHLTPRQKVWKWQRRSLPWPTAAAPWTVPSYHLTRFSSRTLHAHTRQAEDVEVAKTTPTLANGGSLTNGTIPLSPCLPSSSHSPSLSPHLICPPTGGRCGRGQGNRPPGQQQQPLTPVNIPLPHVSPPPRSSSPHLTTNPQAEDVEVAKAIATLASGGSLTNGTLRPESISISSNMSELTSFPSRQMTP